MTLADDAAAGPPEPLATSRSKIDVWLATLTDEDRAAALAVLHDTAWQHTQVAGLFKRHGLTIAAQSVGHWRNSRGITL